MAREFEQTLEIERYPRRDEHFSNAAINIYLNCPKAAQIPRCHAQALINVAIDVLDERKPSLETFSYIPALELDNLVISAKLGILCPDIDDICADPMACFVASARNLSHTQGADACPEPAIPFQIAEYIETDALWVQEMKKLVGKGLTTAEIYKKIYPKINHETQQGQAYTQSKAIAASRQDFIYVNFSKIIKILRYLKDLDIQTPTLENPFEGM